MIRDTMINVDIHETIHQPIEVVFEHLVDIDRYTEWMPQGGLFVSSSQLSKGPVGEDTRYRDETRFGTVMGKVAEFRRPDRVVFHYTARIFGARAIDGYPGYTLERAGDRETRIHHHAEGRIHGLFKLLQPLFQRMAEKERRRTVDALKASLESESG